jgi:outer membrane protein, heavy metal efflux system
MRIRIHRVALCAMLCVPTAVTYAQTPLTLASVLARARERAPQVVNARLGLEEVRGRLLGASLRLQSNPELDVGFGHRSATEQGFLDFELGVAQRFEPRARRSARIGGATAAIAQGQARLDETTRLALRSAAAAFYRALHAEERITVLDATRDLSANVLSVAERRFRAGDIAVLDVNLARASLARGRAERQAADAARVAALGELKLLLALDGDVTVAGTLTPPADVALDTALADAAARPELRELEAALREAEAEVRLGEAFKKPELGFGARFSREEGDRILFGGLTISLPASSSGQELRAVGSARAARVRAEIDAARRRIALEVRTAFDAFTRRQDAVRILATEAVAGLDENDTLTTRSFDVGQIGLPDLLLIRREILDTRSQYLDALLEAALARVELDASAAILR